MRCCRIKNQFLLAVTSLFIFTVLHWYNTTPRTHQNNYESVYRASPSEFTPENEQPTPQWLRGGEVNTFTDILLDLGSFKPDREFTERVVESESESEITSKFSQNEESTNRTIAERYGHVAWGINPGVAKQVPDVERPSWLFDNPRIRVNPVITEDVLPDYFDPNGDLVTQFERYHDQTGAIIDSRLKTLEESCERIRQYVVHDNDFVFFFPELNMGWCPVFKAASTNWKQFFCKIYLPEVYQEWQMKTDQDPYCPLGELLAYTVKQREIKLKEMNDHQPDFDGLAALRELKMRVNRSVKFLTVRHPYERIVSMYTNKFKDCVAPMFSNPEGLMVQILRIYRKIEEKISPDEKARLIEAARSECRKPIEERHVDKNNPYMNPMGATFKEVMQFIISSFKKGIWPDFHWIQVTKSCDVCSKNYRVIEKFETLERDHYFLLKILGEEARYPEIAGRHGNPSIKGRDPHSLVVQYLSQLDEYVLWDLQSVYKDDFKAFGYKPHFLVTKNPYVH